MEQRLSLVTLGVEDLARSIAFYEALGWTRSMKALDSVAFFQMGGIGLSLYPRAELAKDIGEPVGAPSVGTVTLAHNGRTREDVDAVMALAERAGARIVKPAEEAFWGGYSGYFADPDGHLWEVAWNPGFPVAEDGAISIPD